MISAFIFPTILLYESRQTSIFQIKKWFHSSQVIQKTDFNLIKSILASVDQHQADISENAYFSQFFFLNFVMNLLAFVLQFTIVCYFSFFLQSYFIDLKIQCILISLQILNSMIKRTNSFELDDKEGQIKQTNQINRNTSKDHIFEQQQQVEHVHDPPNRSIGLRDITMSQTVPAPGARQSQVVNKSARNTKIPQPILQTIVKLATGKKPIASMTTSKMAKAIFEKARELKGGNNFLCDICACQYDESEKKKISRCSHSFCDSCLRHYVDYKISRFQEVSCPAEECPEIIDIEGDFYKSLTDQLKQKYKKVHAFSMVSKNPNSRLCPDQKCKDGIVQITEGIEPKCSRCNKVYCGKCMFPAHTGPCQNNQIDFFQNNLHFRQCTNCKAVVQKTVGCNHITCRCGYQFCYLCGGKWLNYEHKCGRNDQGVAIPPQNQARCCQCAHGNNCCSTLCRIFIKILLVPVFLLMFAVFLMQTITTLAGALFLTILMGIFPYTFQIICDMGCPFNLLLTLIYPLVMLVGLARSFGDFCGQASGRIIQFFCQNTADLIECLFGWQ